MNQLSASEFYFMAQEEVRTIQDVDAVCNGVSKTLDAVIVRLSEDFNEFKHKGRPEYIGIICGAKSQERILIKRKEKQYYTTFNTYDDKITSAQREAILKTLHAIYRAAETCGN